MPNITCYRCHHTFHIHAHVGDEFMCGTCTWLEDNQDLDEGPENDIWEWSDDRKQRRNPETD